MNTPYESLLSKRAQAIPPSPIRRFFDLAESMDDVISLGVGEPDFRTPWPIRSAAISTLEHQAIFYGPNSGLLALRQEISRYMARRFSLSYSAEDELLVTVGGSEAVDLTLRTLINPGDEVLVTEPCFVCYAPLVSLADGVPVALPTKEENDFRLTAEQLRGAITEKTKLLILSYPNNPTGAVLKREDCEALAEVLRGTDIFVLSDEIYAELTYGAKHASIAQMDGMRERTVVVNGFSKAFAMTGWRLGWLAAPAPIVEQARKIHQYGIMCAPMVSQRAALTALRDCDGEVLRMTQEYDRRRRYLLKRFEEMGLPCFTARGAFYLFPSIAKTGLSSADFCEKLLEEEKVAVVPGSAFGESGEGNLRISYAYSLQHLREAADRMERFLARL